LNKTVNTEGIEIDAANLHYRDLNKKIKSVINRNTGHAISISLKNVLGQRYIGDGVTGNINIKIHGTPGNDLAAFMDGPTIEVYGNKTAGSPASETIIYEDETQVITEWKEIK